MKKLVIALIAIGLALTGLSQAEVFDMKYMRSGKEGLRASDKASGEDLWQSEISVSKIKHEGKNFLYIREEGAGIYGKDKKYKTWVSEAYYSMKNGQPVPYQTSLVYKDREGEVLSMVSKVYDPKSEKVVVTIDGSEKELDFKADLIDKEILGTALQNYPFDEKRDVKFHLLTNEPTMYKITVKYIGLDTVELGGEKVECHKLQMIPDLGLLNMLGAFVPKTYFWYRTSAPYEYVKYEGLESGLGTPYIVLETAPKKE